MNRGALLLGLAWLLVSASTSPAATITRGPYLQSATPTSVVIRWRTGTPTDTRVHIGPMPEELLEAAFDPVAATEHEVVLTNLVPGTRYAYQVGSSLEVLAGGDSCSFTTLPLAGADVSARVWIVGDSGTGGAQARSVRDGYAAFEARSGRPADLWLMLGDNAYQNGTDAEYQTAVFDVYPQQLRNLCLYPTRGNHDAIHAGASNDYYDLFTMPIAGEAGGLASGTEAWYSFDYGRVHFVCLDSEGSGRSPSSPMLQWLRADLAATTADWIIAFWHHPPYSKGSHDSDNTVDSGGRMRDMRLNVVPILDSAGVDLTLSGHSHSYERSFLLSGHYGVSSTLDDDMRVDDGDGRPDGDGPYQKSLAGAPLDGIVHTVAGTSGQISGGALDHPVMVSSQNRLGSFVVDVAASRLEARFVDAAGAVRDSFTILKDGPLVVVPTPGRGGARLELAGPNPFATDTRLAFELERASRVELVVVDAAGRRVRTLLADERAAGRHAVGWDGRDGRGARLPAGLYFAVLLAGRETASTRLVLAP